MKRKLIVFIILLVIFLFFICSCKREDIIPIDYTTELVGSYDLYEARIDGKKTVAKYFDLNVSKINDSTVSLNIKQRNGLNFLSYSKVAIVRQKSWGLELILEKNLKGNKIADSIVFHYINDVGLLTYISANKID